MASTRFLRILFANMGPKRRHYNLTVSWQMSTPRSCSRSSTYIMTTSRITSGELSN